MDELTVGSERVRVRRQPERGRYDRASVHAVLDAGLLAHVAFVDDRGQPWCIPMLYARIGDDVHIHGSTGSRTIRTLAAGAPACLTVTLLDGVVLARSAFEHSANYRSVVLVGSFHSVDDAERRIATFEAFTNKLVPGRWAEVRPPNRKELAASWILAMPIGEASVKARSGPPSDGDSPDAALDTWAGVVPLATRFGSPQPAPELRPGAPLSRSVGRLLTRDTDAPGGS
jgi:nitroimidazol reductase NimA-like FMN-containing flavoprotein (pyridoxamine 5'-phosphate oxidase superfamily)